MTKSNRKNAMIAAGILLVGFAGSTIVAGDSNPCAIEAMAPMIPTDPNGLGQAGACADDISAYAREYVGEGVGAAATCVNAWTETHATPVTSLQTGHGGSWYQLFQEQDSGRVFVTYGLSTENMNNEPDNWLFGIELENSFEGAEREPTYYDQLWDETQSGGCNFVGYAATGSFPYYIQAGATGWSSSSSCTETHTWQRTYGVEFKITGPETSFEMTFGDTKSCSDGSVFDAGVLISVHGETNALCAECLEPTSHDLQARNV